MFLVDQKSPIPTPYSFNPQTQITMSTKCRSFVETFYSDVFYLEYRDQPANDNQYRMLQCPYVIKVIKDVVIIERPQIA